MNDARANAIRFGIDGEPSRCEFVRAGPLTAAVENGGLRWVTAGGIEVVRGVYFAIRDVMWNTIEPCFSRYDLIAGEDDFELRLAADHVICGAKFSWQGSIIGSSDGQITFTWEALPTEEARVNRAGLCVLHPMSLAGSEVTFGSGNRKHAGRFPEDISPHQPFSDFDSMSYVVSSGKVEIQFDGAKFETEDQRNWTDASYKTYTPPLVRPFGYSLATGKYLRQKIDIRWSTGSVRRVSLPRDIVVVDIGPTEGTMPDLGFATPSINYAHDEADIQLIAALQAGHIREVVYLDEADWSDRLDEALRFSAALNVALDIEVIGDVDHPNLESALLRSMHTPYRTVFFYGLSNHVVDVAHAAKVLKVLKENGLSMAVGGGSRANFAEFNRSDHPLYLLDTVEFAINPQVHAFDDQSLIETLTVQALAATAARARIGSRDLAVSPIGLRRRFNSTPAAAYGRALRPPYDPQIDHRQASLFAAGWTVGSIMQLARGGANSLTYFETIGEVGLAERIPSDDSENTQSLVRHRLFPVFHIFAALAGSRGLPMHRVEVSDPSRVVCLAWELDGDLNLLIANVSHSLVQVDVNGPLSILATQTRMTAENASQWRSDSSAFAHSAVNLGEVRFPLRQTMEPAEILRIVGVPQW